MPAGVYKRTKEHIRKITENSIKTKMERYGNACGPTAGWNKGLTKETNANVRKNAESLSKFLQANKKFGKDNPKWIPREIRYCACGCGNSFECKPNSKREYMLYHHVKLPKKNNTNLLKGKTYDEIYGEEKAEELRKLRRLARLHQQQLDDGRSWANYNPKACEFFKSFDEEHNTEGKYAMYGGGEHFVKELGYWVDYFNPDMKLIMEYDEPFHYNRKGELREEDRIRQEEIQKIYPDFDFKRISERAV